MATLPQNATPGTIVPPLDQSAPNGRKIRVAASGGLPARWMNYVAQEYVLPVGTDTVLGGVKQGSGPIVIAPDGKLNVDALSTTQANTAIAGAAAIGTAAGVAAAAAQGSATGAAAAAANAQSSANTAIASAAAAMVEANASVHSIVLSGTNLLGKDKAGNVVSTVGIASFLTDAKLTGASLDPTSLVFTATNSDGTTVTSDLRSLKAVNAIYSITGNGDGQSLKLAGDVDQPGSNKVYGTDANGARAWVTPARPIKIFTAASPPPANNLGVETGDELHDGGIVFKWTNAGGGMDWVA